MAHLFKVSAIAVSMSLCALAASAQGYGSDNPSFQRSGPYIGAGASFVYDSTDYRIPGNTNATNPSNTYGLNAYVGARYKWVGLELSVSRLGTTGFDGTDSTGYVNREQNFTVAGVSLVGFFPIGERWEFVPRLGLNVSHQYGTGEQCRRRNRSGSTRTYECQENTIIGGIGMRYAFTEHWGARVDYTYMPVQDSRFAPRNHFHHLGASLEYRF